MTVRARLDAASVRRLREFRDRCAGRHGPHWPLTASQPASSRRRTPTTASTSLQAVGRRATTAGSSTSRSAPRATPRRRPSSRPWRELRCRAGLPGVDRPAAFREAAPAGCERRLGVDVLGGELAACIGTKEFVAGVPHWLRLRRPVARHGAVPGRQLPDLRDGRDAGRVPGGARRGPATTWRLDLDAIDPADVERALCLWVNTPGNPTGGLDDLGAAAAWGRVTACRSSATSATSSSPGPARRGPSSSTAPTAWWPCTRCRSARTSPGPGRASTPATPSSCTTCREVRKHAGFMVPGPVQAAAVAAWDDDAHVDEQRERYRPSPGRDGGGAHRRGGCRAAMPDGALLPVGPGTRRRRLGLARRLAATGGVLVSPGEFYGPAGRTVRPGGRGPARRSAGPRRARLSG